MSQETITLLIVEDDEIDLQSITRALSDLRIGNPTRHAKDGIEALSLLRGTFGHDKLEGKCIVLLDLNMPRMNGFQFLKAIREEDGFKDLDVFVLTTSETDNDIISAYELDVKGYIFKSDLKDSLKEAFDTLTYPWSMLAPAA